MPPQATALVHATICESYGVAKVEDVFAEFDDAPLGSASIGQVHRARLRDGREVAVKVQYGAGNEDVMRTDIRNGKRAAMLLAPELGGDRAHLEQRLQELDERAEHATLRHVDHVAVFALPHAPRLGADELAQLRKHAARSQVAPPLVGRHQRAQYVEEVA